MKPVRVGCSGWNYQSWRATVYPEGLPAEAELEAWVRRFEDWRERVEILAYFNNDWEEFAVRNGLWMRKRLGV